jgi:hypothetical protein
MTHGLLVLDCHGGDRSGTGRVPDAAALGNRWRLQSPFLEHFSQAFARFFMRVGLPSAVPPFTD